MPLAVAAAGALLATAEISVAEYLRQLRRQPEPELAEDIRYEYPPDVCEGLESLPRLAAEEVRRRRPAAGNMLRDGPGHQPGTD